LGYFSPVFAKYKNDRVSRQRSQKQTQSQWRL